MTVMMRYTSLQTEWGFVSIVASSKGVCGLRLPEPTTAGAQEWAESHWPGAESDADVARDLQRQIQRYFTGRPVAFDGDVDLSARSEFDRRVLAACRCVPYGSTITYGELARRIGRPGAARAVGGALARNPIPLVIPCHRVVAGNGALGGFSAPEGVACKRRLLDLESARPARASQTA